MHPLQILSLLKDRASIGFWEQWKNKVHNQQRSSSEDKHKELGGTFSTTLMLVKKRKESIP